MIHKGQCLEEVIGKGAQAVVYRGHDVKNGTEAAIKEISLDKVDENSLKQVQVNPIESSQTQAEIQLIMQLNHPFVIKLLDHFLQGSNYYICYEYI